MKVLMRTDCECEYLFEMFFAVLLALALVSSARAEGCADVTAKYQRSVVSVEIKKTDSHTGAVITSHGTGFIIAQTGNVLTSRSLFGQDGNEGSTAALDITGAVGSRYATKEEMEYLTSNEIGDVAVLRFRDTSKKLSPIRIGDPWKVEEGQAICALGFPLDLEFFAKPGTVTGRGAPKGWWYSDIPFNSGSEGAPVFDTQSQRVIGIVGAGAGALGIGYIVPINLTNALLSEFANSNIQLEAGNTLASSLESLSTGPDRSSGNLPGPPAGSPRRITQTNRELQSRGRSVLTSIWKTANIPVCWENPSPQFEHEMSVVEKEVADSWGKVSQLRFTGWQKCAAENRGIRILIDDSGPRTAGLGRSIDGVTNGMVINFTFAKWGSSCQAKRDDCIRAITGHLFGHALGFGNEQNKPDAPPECKILAQGETTTEQLTPYDPNSIMNYCNTRFFNSGDLSPLDIEAVRMLYGVPDKD
jgi:S1-C subfamily serine protease